MLCLERKKTAFYVFRVYTTRLNTIYSLPALAASPHQGHAETSGLALRHADAWASPDVLLASSYTAKKHVACLGRTRRENAGQKHPPGSKKYVGGGARES